MQKKIIFVLFIKYIIYYCIFREILSIINKSVYILIDTTPYATVTQSGRVVKKLTDKFIRRIEQSGEDRIEIVWR